MAYVRIPEDDSAPQSLGCGAACSCGGCRQSGSRVSGLGERYFREQEQETMIPQAVPASRMPRPGANLSGWGYFGKPLRRRRSHLTGGMQLRMPAFATITGFTSGAVTLGAAQLDSISRAAEFIAHSCTGASPVTSVRITGYIDANEPHTGIGQQRAVAVRDALLHRLDSLRPGLAVRLRWITEDRGRADIAKVNIYLWVQQKKWQQDQIDARLQGFVDRRGLSMYPNLGQGQSASTCSGWESDKESFSKRVAELYMRTVLGQSLPAKSIRQASQVRWEVRFSDEIVIGVVFAQGFVAAARMGTPLGPVRHYNYSCTATGDLVLTDRPLPKHP